MSKPEAKPIPAEPFVSITMDNETAMMLAGVLGLMSNAPTKLCQLYDVLDDVVPEWNKKFKRHGGNVVFDWGKAAYND